MNYLTKLKLRSESKIRTKEQQLATDISKELNLPFREIYFGMLIGPRRVGYQGVFTAYRECQEGDDRAKLFRYLIEKQKESTWK